MKKFIQEFDAYYRNDCTHHDDVYYVRGQYDEKICPPVNHFDPGFSTSFDGMLAEMMAKELMLGYVEERLKPTCKVAEAATINTVGATASSSLECTNDIVDVVELGYALYAIGFFNNGKATLKNIMNRLSVMCRVDLKEYSRTFQDIQNRKGGITNFMDEMKTGLIKYVDKLDKRKRR